MTTEETIADIRHKLMFGLPPLTLDECRWLYLLATGEEIATKPRCNFCHAEGKVMGNKPCPYCHDQRCFQCACPTANCQVDCFACRRRDGDID